MSAGASISYVTSTGGLMWEKWQKECKKVMDCSAWENMVGFVKDFFFDGFDKACAFRVFDIS